MSNLPSLNSALRLLKQANCEKNVIVHSLHVSRLATEIAKKCKKNNFELNSDLVKIGGLLHDIGRSVTHDVWHGIRGAEILRTFKLPEEVVRIVEHHVGAGIPKNEAETLGFPPKDYMPLTIEEKIVCYSDKLIKKNRIMSFKEALHDMEKTLPSNHPAFTRFTKLHEEIMKMTDGEIFDRSIGAKTSTRKTYRTSNRIPK